MPIVQQINWKWELHLVLMHYQKWILKMNWNQIFALLQSWFFWKNQIKFESKFRLGFNYSAKLNSNGNGTRSPIWAATSLTNMSCHIPHQYELPHPSGERDNNFWTVLTYKKINITKLKLRKPQFAKQGENGDKAERLFWGFLISLFNT